MQRFDSVGREFCHTTPSRIKSLATSVRAKDCDHVHYNHLPHLQKGKMYQSEQLLLFFSQEGELKSKIFLIGKKKRLNALGGFSQLSFTSFVFGTIWQYLSWLCRAESSLSLLSLAFLSGQQFSKIHHLVWPVTDWTLVILKMSSLCLKGFGLSAWQKAIKISSLGLLHAIVEPGRWLSK